MEKETNFGSLRKFNIFMGTLHFLQGCLMLYFAMSIDKVKDFTKAITSNFLTFDFKTMSLVNEQKEIGLLPFAIFVAAFLFLSALFHFIVVLPKTNTIYNSDLKKGLNKFRWYEYSLSSSLIICLIALLFGINDFGTLIAIFSLNACMNLFGLLMEDLNQYTTKTKWSPFVFGSIAGITPWIIIVFNAFGNSDLSRVPWFVFALVISYFVFFNLFPINMILQYKKVGKWKDYIYGERVYIILSLVAKTVLAWIVFAGVMQP